MINLALIGSQSNINMGGSRRTQDLAFKSLNSFMIQSRVGLQKRAFIGFEKGFHPKISGRLI